MGLFRFLFQRPRKNPTVIDWGHSHPKEALIEKTIIEIEAETIEEPIKSVRAHLSVCKPCAEVACGFWNRLRANQGIVA